MLEEKLEKEKPKPTYEITKDGGALIEEDERCTNITSDQYKLTVNKTITYKYAIRGH